MGSKIRLQNREPSPVHLILPHEAACSGDGCFCSRTTQSFATHDRRTGVISYQEKTVRIAGALTLMGAGHKGDRSEVLPAAVTRAPDVAARVARGALVVLDADPPPPEPTPEEPKTEVEVPTDTSTPVETPADETTESSPTDATDEAEPQADTATPPDEASPATRRRRVKE